MISAIKDHEILKGEKFEVKVLGKSHKENFRIFFGGASRRVVWYIPNNPIFLVFVYSLYSIITVRTVVVAVGKLHCVLKALTEEHFFKLP